MSSEGQKKYIPRFSANDEFFISMYFESDEKITEFFVVANLSKFELHPEPLKPLKLSIEQIMRYFVPKLDNDNCAITYFSNELREMSDEMLREKHPKWIEKRNKDYEIIAPYLNNWQISQYLLGHLGPDISVRSEQLNIDPKAIRRSLNRYLSLGSKKALLPIKFNNVGKGPRTYTKKPGPKFTKNGYPVASESRPIAADDESKIRELVWSHRLDVKPGKVVMKRLHTLFLRDHASSAILVEKSNGTHVPKWVLDPKRSLSSKQFSRLVNKVFSSEEYREITEGRHEYDNNRRDKTQSARDGYHASGLLCEIDSTPLPIYLANPLNPDKRETVGKVHLCLVGCVSTHTIVGFSLTYSAPNWETVQEALLNCMTNKVDFAKEYGMDIDESDWPTQHLPLSIRVDNGPENPTEIIRKVIESDIGIRESSWCPPGKPALKGTIENLIARVQDFLSNVKGTVDKDRDGSHQHASQQAVMQKDDIIRLVIFAITIHNSTSLRTKLLTGEMAGEDVDPTPSSMWRFIVNHPLYGRAKVSQRDLPRFVWKMLKKLKVSVTPNKVNWHGLGYHSSWAEKENWFTQADNHGSYHVEMVMLGGMVDTLYYKDEDNELQAFRLNRDYEQYRGMTLRQMQTRQNKLNTRKHKLKIQREEGLINMEQQIQSLTDNRERFYEGAPLNHAKSIQPDIAERSAVMIADEQRKLALRYKGILMEETQFSSYNVSDDANSDQGSDGYDEFGDVS